MKTAEEKAEAYLAGLMDLNLATFDDDMKNGLVQLLKEQDRDTRHACADRVNQLAMDHDTIVQAHNTIMNTKAL